jgi:K+-transporting ATPase ATPase C chain
MRQLKTAVVVIGVMTLLFGLVYPLVVTGLAQLLFPFRANGSLISSRLRVPTSASLPPVGSAIIGQSFSSPRYFHGRPSDCGYDGAGSAASNLGPSNPALSDLVRERVDSLRQQNGLDKLARVPADIVLSSASGLDPDIGPDAALLQVNRVARVRGLDTAAVRGLVTRSVEPSFLGIFSVSRVNVLQLNLALDSMSTEDK